MKTYKDTLKYVRIEDAICDLEKIICDELDIDLGHDILKPLDDWKGLRSKIEQQHEIELARMFSH